MRIAESVWLLDKPIIEQHSGEVKPYRRDTIEPTDSKLIDRVRDGVARAFDVELELEIEMW